MQVPQRCWCRSPVLPWNTNEAAVWGCPRQRSCFGQSGDAWLVGRPTMMGCRVDFAVQASRRQAGVVLELLTLL